MAKKSKEQEPSAKKSLQEKIIQQITTQFIQLEEALGKKEFARRLKKSAKLITQGVKLKDQKEEKPAVEEKKLMEPKAVPQPKAAPKKARAAAKKAKPALKKARPSKAQ